jgi:hypothetical protein
MLQSELAKEQKLADEALRSRAQMRQDLQLEVDRFAQERQVRTRLHAELQKMKETADMEH